MHAATLGTTWPSVRRFTEMALEQLLARIAAAALKGGCSELDLATLRLLLEGRSLSTIETAHKVTQIERSLGAMSPGQRREIVCQRLGLSRRRFYELKKLASATIDRTV